MTPRIQFFLADETIPVTCASPLWEARIPMARRESPGGGEGGGPFYADYFSAVEDFLTHEGGRALAQALSLQLGSPVSADRISGARVFLEKHGAFYHPARVRIDIGKLPCSMVLNAALSAPGVDVIGEEYSLLELLGKRAGASFLPRVFAYGFGRSRSGQRFPMFLGQWLENYFEFHVTGNGNRHRLWDPAGSRLLSQDQALEIHRQTARILTHYYDLATGAQIYPWHHAAGDFVARVDDSGVELRLITVRGYRPGLYDEETDPAERIWALVLFFLNLSIRMRLDRIDGVGDLVWIRGPVVEAALLGALEALGQVSAPPSFPAPAADLFLAALAGMADQELSETAEAVAARYDPGTGALIRGHLEAHLKELRNTLNALLGK